MRTRRRRLISLVALCLLSASLGGASLAWACTPSNWGWTPSEAPAPSDPSPPPASQPATPAQTSQPAPPTQSAQPASPSTSAPSQVTRSQPASNPSKQPAATKQPAASKQEERTPTKQPATAQSPARAQTEAAASIAAESSGQSSGAESAFSRSSEPVSPRAGGAGSDKSGRTPAAPAPSKGSATVGNLWSGIGSGKSSSLISSGSDPAAGPGSALAVGLALLGLAAIALLGGFAVTQMRRRRALAAHNRLGQQLDELWHASGGGASELAAVEDADSDERSDAGFELPAEEVLSADEDEHLAGVTR